MAGRGRRRFRIKRIDRDLRQRVLRRRLRATPIHNVNVLHAERLTTGARLADAFAMAVGSWRFIIIQSIILVIWLALNTLGYIRHWDPYPFILLNLALSFQAAYSAPIIMMSQNRQADKDRLAAEEDYRVNIQAEFDVAAIHERLDQLAGAQWDALVVLQTQQLDLLNRIEELTAELHRATVAPH
jgi:uncharacterized membrane protein